MATLSQDDHDIVAKYPLDTSFDHLQESLQNMQQSNRSNTFLFDGGADDPNSERHETISKLLLALMGHKVAYNLHSNIGGGNIATELSKLFGLVQSGRFNYEHFRALSQLIIKKASDVEIWSAVLNLILTVSRATPPASIPASSDSTPVTVSSSSFQGSEQTRNIIETAMFYEIETCTYRNVDGFFNKYFEGRPWSNKSKEIYETVKTHYKGARWSDFPDPPDGIAVWHWISRFQNTHLPNSPSAFYTTASTSDLTGGEARRQLDVFTKRRGIGETGKHNWEDVRVIGELKRSTWDLKSLLLQLARYIGDIFTAQPNRRFVHSFVLHGTTMELWVFDHSGPYSSGEFDIHSQPKKFIQALTGYGMMDDEELGLDVFTELNDQGRFISINENTTGNETRMQIDKMPFVKQRAVVCRGTTCFRSTDQLSVVKFSWTSDKRPPEANHLRLAEEKGVEGVAKLIGFRRITTISQLRNGLNFSSRHRFRSNAASASARSSQTQHSRSRGLGQNFSTSRTKRKRPRNEQDSQKNRRSNSRSFSLGQQEETAQRPSKAAASLYELNGEQYSNRVYGCLVIAPAGKALSEFTQRPTTMNFLLSAIGELLTALRDAIRAHRSLYLKGSILHRDISENNIIIMNPDQTGGFAGMLIDLDLAKVLGSGRSGARYQTGTMEFMAIEVLRGISHTYRHDLESFFYVLLWILGRRVWEWEFFYSAVDRPKRNLLSKWYTGSFADIASAKEHAMGVNGFKELLDEFPAAFDPTKPLCTAIRSILFPYENGLLIGTPSGPPETLYDPIIEAFDYTIRMICRAESG